MSLIWTHRQRNAKWCQRKLTSGGGRRLQESASLQEVGGAVFSVDLELVGSIRGAESVGGGGRHRSHRRGCLGRGGGKTHVEFVSTSVPLTRLALSVFWFFTWVVLSPTDNCHDTHGSVPPCRFNCDQWSYDHRDRTDLLSVSDSYLSSLTTSLPLSPHWLWAGLYSGQNVNWAPETSVEQVYLFTDVLLYFFPVKSDF